MGATAKHSGSVDAPRTVSIRQLSREAGSIVRALKKAGRPAIVTDRGRPIALLFPTDPDEFEDFVLRHAPEFVNRLADADVELARGEGKTLAEYVATSKHTAANPG